MMEDEEIIDQEIDKPITAEQLSQYLDDHFDTHPLPGGQKEAPTVAERLKAAQDRRI